MIATRSSVVGGGSTAAWVLQVHAVQADLLEGKGLEKHGPCTLQVAGCDSLHIPRCAQHAYIRMHVLQHHQLLLTTTVSGLTGLTLGTLNPEVSTPTQGRRRPQATQPQGSHVYTST